MIRTALLAFLVICPCVSGPVDGQAVDPSSPTLAYAASRQNADGGFAAEPGGPSTLGSTTAAVRILRFEGGAIPDPLACIDFVKSCFHAATGGFSQAPGQAPDVGSTAAGLMAMGELKIDDSQKIDAARTFVEARAKEFPDIRIAVAGLEAVGRKSAKFADWTRLIEQMRGDEPTWGKGSDEAFETGGAAAALLRMGVSPDHRDDILAAMKTGQRPDGGWSAGDSPSDLSATYRVMRAFFMLGARPDLDRLRSFVASCAGPGGGFSVAPDGPASLGATYMAGIVTRWSRLLEGGPATVETAGFTSLIGDSMVHWEGDSSLWSVKQGVLIGRTDGLDRNEFLAHEEAFADFILKVSFRMRDGLGNSGIQFRSERLPGHEMIGYQADIGENFWGCLYDESRRNKVLVQASREAVENVHPDGWNQYVIRAIGSKITLGLNDRTSVQYTEDDPTVARSGRIAVQLHAGGPTEMQFKDMMIQRLPSPLADGEATPGFHVRTVVAEGGPRKYVVYLPSGYDRSEELPVVLFLHGSGERGEDGVVPAQVGLGPALLAAPERFPIIAVFPQARENWSADASDAVAALAALDAVLKEEECDPNRVILTGLSMGGFGTWEMAARRPERFAAISPVCGSPRTARPDDVKHLPIWTFVGDDDQPRLVQGMRAFEAELREAEADLKVTEYRGVGHNSWDRAYSDPDWIEWVLAKRRPDR